MASKKKEEQTSKVILGRPTNSLKMGIVGIPNVGKSTLFNLLTKLSVPAENYPFCTIEPNEARVSVPDARYDWLVNFHKPASQVPAALQVTDIAGLIRGASQGEGLGNNFLSHIRAVDGIYHVVRIFEDAEVTHVDGAVDPVRDLDVINEELFLKDIEGVAKYKESVQREMRAQKNDKKKVQEMETIQRVEDMLNERKLPRLAEWKANEIDTVNALQLLTAKPAVYIINMSENDYFKKGSKWLSKIKTWVDAHGGEPMVPFCGVLETKLVDMDEVAKKSYCEQNKTSSSIGKIIKTGYAALDLIGYFTCGADEVKVWTIRRYTKAPQAAGVIHTDFERGFVCAEVMKFEEFRDLGSENAVKAAGKYRQEGKNYIVEDGDIIYFKANTVGLDKKK